MRRIVTGLLAAVLGLGLLGGCSGPQGSAGPHADGMTQYHDDVGGGGGGY